MPSIRVDRFGGLEQAVTDRHVKVTHATRAHNTELRDGSLRPFRAPRLLSEHDTPIKTVFETNETKDCCSKVLAFPTCVSVTQPFDVLCRPGVRTIVWPEDDERPYWLDCETDERTPLEVPTPTRATLAMQTVPGTMETDDQARPDDRSYTYTFVNSEGLESAPATPSATAFSWDDETWEVLGDPVLPVGVVGVRIYRTTSALDGSDVAASTWQLVEDIDAADWTGVYVDDNCLRDMAMGALNTIELCPPPEGLCDVHELEGGYHVGFVGSTLRFSARHQPHNWPERYIYQLPHQIRGLATNNDIIYVGTSGHPYICRTGTVQDDLTGDVILRCDPVPYDQNYPMLGRRTITMTAWGAAYVGREGIVGLQPSLPARVVSRDRIDEDRWHRFLPNRIAWMNGRLYAGRAPEGEGFIMDVRGEPEGPRDFGDFVTIDFSPLSIHSAPSGRLYYSEGNNVYEWDSPYSREYMEYIWRSRKFVTPGRLAMNAGKVVADYGPDVQVSLERDRLVVLNRPVGHRRPFRVKRSGRGIEFVIELRGTAVIHEAHFATSVSELSLAYEQGNVAP